MARNVSFSREICSFSPNLAHKWAKFLENELFFQHFCRLCINNFWRNCLFFATFRGNIAQIVPKTAINGCFSGNLSSFLTNIDDFCGPTIVKNTSKSRKMSSFWPHFARNWTFFSRNREKSLDF